MKSLMYGVLALLFIWSCSGTKTATVQKNKTQHDAVKIANDSLQYDITIIDSGFNYYLNTMAKPKSFYTESYLENQNRRYVLEWNDRARSGYKPLIYENIIDYDNNIHYGLDVNYKLYNYFKFVENKYGERF